MMQRRPPPLTASVRRVRTAAVAAVAAVATLLLLVLVPSDPSAAQSGDDLSISDRSFSAGTTTIDVVVPPRDATERLAASSFSVEHDGTELPPSVSWFVPSLIVDLVMDARDDGTDLGDLQGAAGDMIDRLPDEVRVRILTPGGTTDTGVDRAAAREALQGLELDERGDIASTIARAPVAQSASPSRAVIAVSSGDADRVLSALRRRTSGTSSSLRTLLWHVVPGGDGSAEVTRAAVRGGSPQGVGRFDDLAAALGHIWGEVTGSYRLLVQGVEPGEQLTVRLTTSAGAASAQVDVPEPVEPAGPDGTGDADESPTGPAEPSGEDAQAASSGGAGWVLPVVLVAVAALLAAGVVVLLRRREDGSTGPGPSDAPRAVRRPDRPRPAPTPPPARAEPAPAPAPSPVGRPQPATTASPPTTAAPQAAPATARPAADAPSAAPSAAPSGTTVPLFGPGRARATATPPAPTPQPSPQPPPEVEVAAATAPSGGAPHDVDRTTLIAAAEHAESALSALAARRARPGPHVPRVLLIAVEATASAWLDDAEVTTADVVRLLDGNGPEARRSVATTAEALGRSLGMGPLPFTRAAPRVAQLLDRTEDVTRDLSDPDDVLDLRRSLDVDPSSILDEVTAIVSVERGETPPPDGALAGRVERCLLATWASRHGRLDDVPLVISPSLDAGDTRMHPSALPPRDLALLVLAAVSDAARRMLDAEEALATLHRHYRDRLREHTDRTATADRLAALVVRRPVIGLGHASSVMRMSPERTRAQMEELTRHGWLRAAPPSTRRVEDRRTTGTAPLPPSTTTDLTERWIAQQVVDAVLAPFADAGLTSATPWMPTADLRDPSAAPRPTPG